MSQSVAVDGLAITVDREYSVTPADPEAPSTWAIASTDP